MALQGIRGVFKWALSDIFQIIDDGEAFDGCFIVVLAVPGLTMYRLCCVMR